MQVNPSQAVTPVAANEEIIQWSAIELSRRAHARDVSCMKVMETFLAQIDRHNPTVNAVVAHIDAESAIGQTRERDMLLLQGLFGSWMHGFLQAPKDLTITVGMMAAVSSLAMTRNMPTHDSIVAERIRRQSTVLIDKANTSEFGLGSHTYSHVYGTTHSVWNPERSADGNSGSTAAALALNMLPVADGNDMMGSLRNPAAWSNTYDLRPSLDRVLYDPAGDVFFQQLGAEGLMARNPQDPTWLPATQAGYDPRASLSLSDDPAYFMQPLHRDFQQARVGWLGDFGGHLAIDTEVLAVNEHAFDTFDILGCHVKTVRPFFTMDALWEYWRTLRTLSMSGNLGLLYANATTCDLLKLEAIWEIEHGRSRTAIDINRAIAARASWCQAPLQQFARYDFFILPCTQAAPSPAEEHWPKTVADRTVDTYHHQMGITIGATLTGVPAASLPSNLTADDLPLGLQVITPPRSEFTLLQLTAA